MSRWMLDIWEMQRKDNLHHLVPIQVELHCLQGEDLEWDLRNRVLREIQEGQLGEATVTEGFGEAGQLV